MNIKNEYSDDEFRPRLLVWQLTPDHRAVPITGGATSPEQPTDGILSTSECLLILENIAYTAKPIIVLTGPDILQRPDLYGIVEYGIALGLKIIIETSPRNLTDSLIRKFSVFGPKVFRILLDGCVVENVDTRYNRTLEFLALEEKIRRLRDEGFEIHLGVTIRRPDIRELAFNWDYAFRIVANGLYCNLSFDEDGDSKKHRKANIETPDELIQTIARMKQFSPEKMYISPQCVKYGIVRDNHEEGLGDGEGGQNGTFEWKHWCLAGKTFAYINHAGQVQVCAGMSIECGSLRANNYEFKKIWYESKVLRQLRQSTLSCSETQAEFKSLSIDKPERSENRR
ncbi:MAG: hypothetical protein ABSF91_03415 [Bacteroidota bacterium]|jgi:MoaA/NifB/PqqE/SkfB family radical SAM enzyme